MIDFSPLVESRLTAIWHHPEDAIAVFTCLKRGTIYEIQAHGIERLLVMEFREQNIVDEVIIYSRTDSEGVVFSRIAELFFGKADLMDNGNDVRLGKTRMLCNMVDSRERILVEIAPVFGASVLLFGTHVGLSSRVA